VAATTLFGGGLVHATLESRFRPAFVALRRGVVVAVQAGVPVTVPLLVTLFTGMAVAELLWSAEVGAVASFPAALAVAVPSVLWFARRGAGWTRRRMDRWYGVRLRPEYTSREPLEQDARGYWWTGYSYHRDHTVARLFQYGHWVVRDPETRRELLWLVTNPAAAAAIVGPVLLLAVGGTVFALSAAVDSRTYGPIDSQMVLSYVISIVIGTAVALAGLLLAPYAVRAHTGIACRVLGGGDRPSHAQLSRRVVELTETRADAVDAQAAELRRIERDLHDGAQARLVAIGLTLGTIEHLMETDPSAARELLGEARQSSARALQELRDLVRGIHPPVLAERGLADAVRELALGSLTPTEVTVSLPGRPEAPMETAAYFCVSELLANAAKHSGAGRVWVDILFRAGLLRVTVTDDGRGGAAFEGGSGLRGIERRLGTFDGVLSLSSPLGGPTTITMELPCASSSLRTSTSFEKA